MRRSKSGEKELQISLPSNFQHTSHIGWTDDATFELRNIPPEWKRFFQAAGIRKRDLEDPETRKAIFAVLFNEQGSGDDSDQVPTVEYDDMPGLGPIIYQSGEAVEPDTAEPAVQQDDAQEQEQEQQEEEQYDDYEEQEEAQQEGHEEEEQYDAEEEGEEGAFDEEQGYEQQEQDYTDDEAHQDVAIL